MLAWGLLSSFELMSFEQIRYLDCPESTLSRFACFSDCDLNCLNSLSWVSPRESSSTLTYSSDHSIETILLCGQFDLFYLITQAAYQPSPTTLSIQQYRPSVVSPQVNWPPSINY